MQKAPAWEGLGCDWQMKPSNTDLKRLKLGFDTRKPGFSWAKNQVVVGNDPTSFWC